MKLEDVKVGQELRIVRFSAELNLNEDGTYLRSLLGKAFKVMEVMPTSKYPIRLFDEPYYCWKAEELEDITEKEFKELHIDEEIASLESKLEDLKFKKEALKWEEKVEIAKINGLGNVEANVEMYVDGIPLISGNHSYNMGETQRYYRQGNSITCEIKQSIGNRGVGIVNLEPGDTFDYIVGMKIAEAKAYENLYANRRRQLIKDTYR